MTLVALCLFSLLLPYPLAAADAPPLDPAKVNSVTLKDQLMANLDGKSVPLEINLEFPHEVVIKTNATYTVNEGKPRTLQPGQTLDRRGMLAFSDGRMHPVYDHVTMKNGEVLIMRDGEYSPVTQKLTFPNGIVIYPNGDLELPGQRKTRLLDGQLFTLDGKSIPTRDTISMRDGKVVVQKDGSLITLRPRQTLMMNDGTKVYGNGKVEKHSGETIQLTDGQTIEVEGVRRSIR